MNKLAFLLLALVFAVAHAVPNKFVQRSLKKSSRLSTKNKHKELLQARHKAKKETKSKNRKFHEFTLKNTEDCEVCENDYYAGSEGCDNSWNECYDNCETYIEDEEGVHQCWDECDWDDESCYEDLYWEYSDCCGDDDYELTPADIITICDQDGSEGITLQEGHDCIDEWVEDPEENHQAHNELDEYFDYVDSDGSGEVDVYELQAAFEEYDNYYYGGGYGYYGGPDCGYYYGGGYYNHYYYGNHYHYGGYYNYYGGPSASDIIDACDFDNSGGITREEAHTCIDQYIEDPEENAQLHNEVDEGFDEADTDGSGEVDVYELEEAMSH